MSDQTVDNLVFGHSYFKNLGFYVTFLTLPLKGVCTIFDVEHMLNGGMPNAPLPEGFFFLRSIIRLACRSQNVVRILTLSKYPQFSPLFSPPIAISFKVEIFLSNMLTINGGSQFSSPKRIFFCNNTFGL